MPVTGLTKIDLAKQTLLLLRDSVSCRLLSWIAVTKAKRNTALFRKVIEPGTRRERYVLLTPVMLIREVFKELTRKATPA